MPIDPAIEQADPRLNEMLHAVMVNPADEAGWAMLYDFSVEHRIPKSSLFNRLFWVWAETHGWGHTDKDMDPKEWQVAYDGFLEGIHYLTTRLGFRSEKDTHFSEQDSRLLKQFLFENPGDQAGRNAYIDSMIENRMTYEAAAQEAQKTCWDGFINLITIQPGKQTVDGFVQFLTGPPRNWSREQAIEQIILQRFGHSPQLSNYQHVLSMTLDHPSGESIGDATLEWLATAPEADIIRWADEEEDTHEAEAQYVGEPLIYEADAYIVQTNQAVEHILDELIGPGATYRDLQEYCQGEIEAEDLDAPAPLSHGWYVQGDQEQEGTLHETELEAYEAAIEYFGYPGQPYQWEYPLLRRIRQLRREEAEGQQQPPEQHAEFAEGDPRLDRLVQLIGEDPENQAAWMAYTDQCIELRLSARDAWIYLFDYIIPTDAKDVERRADLVKDRGGYENRKLFKIHSPEWKALVAGKTKYLGGQYKHNFGVPDTEIKPWAFAEYGPNYEALLQAVAEDPENGPWYALKDYLEEYQIPYKSYWDAAKAGLFWPDVRDRLGLVKQAQAGTHRDYITPEQRKSARHYEKWINNRAKWLGFSEYHLRPLLQAASENPNDQAIWNAITDCLIEMNDGRAEAIRHPGVQVKAFPPNVISIRALPDGTRLNYAPDGWTFEGYNGPIEPPEVYGPYPTIDKALEIIGKIEEWENDPANDYVER